MGRASSETSRGRGLAVLLIATLSGCVLPEALEWTGEAGGAPTGSSSGSTGAGGTNAGSGGGGAPSSTTTGGGGAASSTGGGGAASSTGAGGATSSTGGGGATTSAGGGGAAPTTGAGGGGPTTWSIVQFGAVSDSGYLDISPTTAGNFLVVVVETTKMSNVVSVTDNAANIYSIVPNTHAVHNSAGSAVDYWYAQNINAGATQITVGLTGTMYALMIWEVSGIVTTGSPVDAVGVLEATGSTTTPVGASVTTTVAGDFIVSLALLGTNSAGISPGNEFTSDSNLRGNGWAHITSPVAVAGFHQAQWEQPGGGSYCSATAAFKSGP